MNYKPEEITEVFLKNLINNTVEESIHLDFKSANALDKTAGKKHEIAKDVSAFANSDGGMIIYGMEEVNHVASAYSYVDGNSFTKEWLEQVINSGIARRIQNIKIIPVRIDNDVAKTLYAVLIPKSSDSPHMAGDKYYKRFNFQSVAMAEYEVRDGYQRIKDQKLIVEKVETRLINRETFQKDKIYRFAISIRVKNVGPVIVEKYKVRASMITSALKEYYWERQRDSIKFIIQDDKGYMYSTNMEPLFPEETIESFSFGLKVPITGLEKYAGEKMSVKIQTLHERKTKNFLFGDHLIKIANDAASTLENKSEEQN